MEPIISAKNASMMFNLSRDRVIGLKEYVVRALKGQLFFDEFWALRDVSFEIYPGEVVGIIGFNGAGKSTLLKLIAGVFKPTKGTIAVKGDVAPLLELGAGFNPEFSARDNIYMNGAMFGRSPSQMDSIFDKIMDFSELWEFVNVPLKNYSSGMYMRLGFAVATEIEPDILIVDEVLNVGDFQFAKKCDERIITMVSCGTTVLVVAHSTDAIKKFCTRAMLLQGGKLTADGQVDEVCEIYHQSGS